MGDRPPMPKRQALRRESPRAGPEGSNCRDVLQEPAVRPRRDSASLAAAPGERVPSATALRSAFIAVSDFRSAAKWRSSPLRTSSSNQRQACSLRRSSPESARLAELGQRHDFVPGLSQSGHFERGHGHGLRKVLRIAPSLLEKPERAGIVRDCPAPAAGLRSPSDLFTRIRSAISIMPRFTP